MPKALQSRPELNEYLRPYLSAFITLSAFRNDSGRIGFSDIVLYAEKIDESEVLDFVSVILSGERAYTDAMKEKENLKNKVKGNG